MRNTLTNGQQRNIVFTGYSVCQCGEYVLCILVLYNQIVIPPLSEGRGKMGNRGEIRQLLARKYVQNYAPILDFAELFPIRHKTLFNQSILFSYKQTNKNSELSMVCLKYIQLVNIKYVLSVLSVTDSAGHVNKMKKSTANYTLLN